MAKTPDTSIQAQFDNADGERQNELAIAREAAAFTDPTMLPPDSTSPGMALNRAYQCLGTDGLENLVSKMIVAHFPPGIPWSRYIVSEQLRRDPQMQEPFSDATGVWPSALMALEAWLYERERTIMGEFAATDYRVKMRTTFQHILGVGNSMLECLGKYPNYGFRNYRFDNFVQRRGSDSKLIWLIVRERMHHSELSDEILAKANLRRDDLKRNAGRVNDLWLYTRAAKDTYGATKWTIEQELNKVVVNTSVEQVNPFIAVGYRELCGENYSRGFVEERLPELRSVNGLTKATLDMAVAAAKLHPVIDPSTSGGMEPDDPVPVLVG